MNKNNIPFFIKYPKNIKITIQIHIVIIYGPVLSKFYSFFDPKKYPNASSIDKEIIEGALEVS